MRHRRLDKTVNVAEQLGSGLRQLGRKEQQRVGTDTKRCALVAAVFGRSLGAVPRARPGPTSGDAREWRTHQHAVLCCGKKLWPLRLAQAVRNFGPMRHPVVASPPSRALSRATTGCVHLVVLTQVKRSDLHTACVAKHRPILCALKWSNEPVYYRHGRTRGGTRRARLRAPPPPTQGQS